MAALQFLDTGLLNNALSLQGEILHIRDINDLHRGKIAQHLVTQQLISIETGDRYQLRSGFGVSLWKIHCSY